MKSIASINVQQAQSQIEKIRLYQEEIINTINQIYSLFPEISKIIPDGEKLFIIWGSDQGLCGTFNKALIQKANNISNAGKNIKGFILVGKRLDDNFTGKRLNILPAPVDISSIYSYANNLIKDISEIYSTGQIQEINLVYNQFKGIGSFKTIIKKVFPFISKNNQPDYPPIVDMNPQDLLNNALFEYIYGFIYQAYLESFLSENGIRLMNMSSASKNIDEKIQNLQYENNFSRQEEITAEMLEIISSYGLLVEK